MTPTSSVAVRAETGTVRLVAVAGRVKVLTVGAAVSPAAATVNVFVLTAISPWASPVLALLPKYAILQVYVPGVVGAGAARVAGNVVAPPMPLALPLDAAIWAPVWPYRIALIQPLLVLLVVRTTDTVSPGA